MNSKKELTSKEALERLGAEKLARGELIRNDDKVEPYINCIKQDLENYEVLKEEHNKVIESTYELSKTFEKINKELEKENAKLKNVIEILKDKIIHHFIKYAKSLNDYNKFIRESEYDELNQEEYNLLKEVFGK